MLNSDGNGDKGSSSGDFYRKVLSSLPAHIAVLDSSGIILEINNAWVKFAIENKANRATTLAIGMDYCSVCEKAAQAGDKLAEEALHGIRAVLSGSESSFDLEYPCHAPAVQRWFLMRVRSLVSGKGVVITHDEITGRKKTEESLRESEERFRSIFNLQFQFMALLSPEGYVQEINDLPLLIGGVKRENVIGRLFWETVWWRDLPEMRERWPLRLEAASHAFGPVLTEDTYMTAEGEVRFANAALTAIRDPKGNLRHFIVQASDITDRRNAEEKIRRLARGLTTILESITDAFFTVDKDWHFTYINGEAERLFQRSRSELIGKNMWEEFPEAIGTTFEEKYRRAADEKITVQFEEYFSPLASWFEVHAYPSEEGLAVYFHDVTARRKAEEQLQASNRDLESFAYIVSHDLKAPLRGIGGYTGMVLASHGDRLDEEGKRYLKNVLESAKHMEALISDLLIFSKVQRVEGAFSEVPLEEALARAIQALQGEIDETGAEIAYDDLPVVWGAVSLLAQLFQNLLSNSIKFRSKDPPRIRITAEERPGEWVIAVKDNSIGIESAFHERIFEVFRRLHSKGYSGTGIGLAICKRIVERHEGRIWVESKPGAGATFYFTLPSKNRGMREV